MKGHVRIGEPFDRVDGREKVSGQARYAAEFRYPNLHYGAIVPATIAAGEILSVDASEALADPDVVGILDHSNAPQMQSVPVFPHGPAGESAMPLQDTCVLYAGHPVALVVAKTPEAARDGAALVKVRYRATEPLVMTRLLASGVDWSEPPEGLRKTTNATRGDVEAAISNAEVLVICAYETPGHNHNALELGAAVAYWDGTNLLLHDSTQWVLGTRNAVSRALGIPLENVRVVSPYVGGGFGSKCFAWSHTLLAVAAARHFLVPVQVVLTRAQAHQSFGSRPAAYQEVTLAADRGGRITGLRHHSVAQTATHDVFLRPAGEVSEVLYTCPNLETRHWILPVHSSTPSNMRAPAESYGSFALESAMDELAEKLQIDPLELRLRNLPTSHPDGVPWSSCGLGKCYEDGAAAFGWRSRPLKPRSIRSGNEWVGWGTAAGTYGCYRSQAAVSLCLRANGDLDVRCASHEIGTGTRSLMVQVAASVLAIAPEKIAVSLGDTDCPAAPVHGASRTAASVAPAVWLASQELRAQLIRMAVTQPGSLLLNCPVEVVETAEGRVRLRSEPLRYESFASIVARAGLPQLIVERRAGPSELTEKDWETLSSGVNTIRFPKTEKVAMYGFSAHFVEVRVQPELGSLRITRAVMRADAGRILNPKHARSQLLGSLVFGIGMALREQVRYDERNGRVLSASPTAYHLAAFGDMPEVDLGFVEQDDTAVNELGAKGVGELGLVGFAAAVSNAVWHATGIRFRKLPITAAMLIERSGEVQ